MVSKQIDIQSLLFFDMEKHIKPDKCQDLNRVYQTQNLRCLLSVAANLDQFSLTATHESQTVPTNARCLLGL